MMLLADLQVPSELVVGLPFALLLGAMSFAGVFHSIKFQKGNMPPRIFVYKTHSGPLSKVGPHFEAVIQFMKDKGFDVLKIPTAGMYYEDPSTTDVPKYAVGFLIDQDDAVSKTNWENVPTEDKAEYSILELKATPTIVSVFPMRWTAISCAVSAMKTYPAFAKSGHELKCGSVEVYRADTKTVETHFPQENHDQFCPQESDTFPGEKKDQ